MSIRVLGLSLLSIALLSACAPSNQVGGEGSAKQANDAPVAKGVIDEAAIKATGQTLFSQEPTDIKMSEIDGLVQMSAMGRIFYASPDGKYFMQGDLIEASTRTSMTERARIAPRQAAFDRLVSEKKIDLSESITFKSPNEAYEVMVFTDVECGFCRKIQEEMKTYMDAGITIHYFPWPRSGLTGPVHDTMVSVWCSKNQQKAIDDAKHNRPVKPATCENPIDKYVNIGHELKISGTPAVFTLDGRQVGGGYMPATDMLKELQNMSPVDRVR